MLNKSFRSIIIAAFVCMNFAIQFDRSIAYAQSERIDDSEFVWKTVSGKVIDTKGDAVKDAIVCHSSIADNPENQTSSNDKGEFILKYRTRKTNTETGHLWAYSPDHNLRAVRNIRKDDHLLVLPDYTEFKIKFSQPDGVPLVGATIEPFRYAVPDGTYSADAESLLGGIIPAFLAKKLATKTDKNGDCLICNIPRELWGRTIVSDAKHGKHIIGGSKKLDAYRLSETASLEIEILPDEPIDFTGTEVSIRGNGPAGETMLDGKIDDKGFCRVDHVLPGEIEIQLKINAKEVYQPKVIPPFAITAGELLLVKIAIKKTVELRGKVVAGDRPVPNATIEVSNRRLMSDENGEFKCRVFIGEASIRVVSMPQRFYKEYETSWRRKRKYFVKDDKGKPFVIDPIELPALTKIQIQVVDEFKKPITGFELRSRYDNKRFGPVSGELNEKGLILIGVTAFDLNNMEDASYFLARKDQKDVKDVTKFIKLKIESTRPFVLTAPRKTD